jgi:hypothetical protein
MERTTSWVIKRIPVHSTIVDTFGMQVLTNTAMDLRQTTELVNWQRISIFLMSLKGVFVDFENATAHLFVDGKDTGFSRITSLVRNSSKLYPAFCTRYAQDQITSLFAGRLPSKYTLLNEDGRNMPQS